jgi:hypothetical protein
MNTSSRGTGDEPESISSPAAPDALALRGDTARTVPKAPVASYNDLWRALRSKHGLPVALTSEEAQKAAEILLGIRAPMGAIRMRSGSQDRGSETSERAGTTTISGKISLISSCRPDRAA